MSYLNGLVVSPTFFNLGLNLAIRSSWSEPQSAPGLVFADCIELLHLWLQRYNQSDFGVDHLVLSMCRVFSCVVGRGCLLWPVRSLGKTLLPLPCFKIRDTKGTCHAKMGSIKDSNGMDLTEAEDIKKRWQEYTEGCTKKIFMTKIIMMVWSLT